jgi:ubiquitin-conjugating enzyme (huntingtin interacting protein 2)
MYLVPGITLQTVDGSISHLKAIIPGPSLSPFEGGKFEIDIKLPESYPLMPPVVYCFCFIFIF